MEPRIVWGAAIGTLIAYDVWCDRNCIDGDTLSECLRGTFRTHTKPGAAVFVGGWVALSRWFIPHILNGPKPRSS